MTPKAGHTFTAGPWEYVPGTEHHGPYVTGPWGGDICDCYTMSNPMAASTRNGGTSFPINHQGEAAEANARLIAAAPELLEALQGLVRFTDAVRVQVGMGKTQLERLAKARAAIAKATAGGAV